MSDSMNRAKKSRVGFLQESNGNWSLMRLMGLMYVLSFAAIAGYSVWKSLETARSNPDAAYVALIFLVAAVFGKNLQKIVEEKGETVYTEGERERSGFLLEDNGARSYTRLQCLALCLISITIGGLTTYFGATVANYQGDGTVFTLLATLGAVCPKLFQKIVEENYGDIVKFAKSSIAESVQSRRD